MGISGTTIMGWAYDADLHCPDCARDAGMDQDGAEDSEGNAPGPVFACSEDWQGEHCGDCRCELGE